MAPLAAIPRPNSTLSSETTVCLPMFAGKSCDPPLCITEEQLLECFEIVDRGLDITDAYFESNKSSTPSNTKLIQSTKL